MCNYLTFTFYVNTWKFYPSSKIFYTNAIYDLCDKFYVCSRMVIGGTFVSTCPSPADPPQQFCPHPTSWNPPATQLSEDIIHTSIWMANKIWLEVSWFHLSFIFSFWPVAIWSLQYIHALTRCWTSLSSMEHSLKGKILWWMHKVLPVSIMITLVTWE